MASKSAELPITPDITKSPEVEIRRNSAGKAIPGNGDKKIVPHYLRASTGSCHDFCKYGREHAFISKNKRSIPDKATRKQLHQSLEKSSIGGMIPKSKVSVDSKPIKMSSVVLKESVDSTPTRMPSVVHKESIDLKTVISDALDTNALELPSKSFDNQKDAAIEVKVNRKKTSSVKVKPSLLKSHTSPSTSQEISSSTDKEVQSQSKSNSRKVETPSKSILKKVTTSSKSTPFKVETLSKSTPPKKVKNTTKATSNVKTSSKSTTGSVEAVSKPTLKKVENPSKSISKIKTSSKSTSKVTEASSLLPSLNGKDTKLSVKHSTSMNSNHVTRKKVLSSVNSSEGFGDKRNSEIKMEKKVTSSKTASRKSIAPVKAISSPRLSLKRVGSLNSRKHKSLKIVSHLRNQKTNKKVEDEELHNNNEVKEKTLYVIKMENENKTLQSDQNTSYNDEMYLPQLSTPMSSSSSVSQSLSKEDQEESEYTTSEFELDSFSGNSELECIENSETLKVENKNKLRKEVDDKDLQMIKLKFRRGKVVDNQIEKNTPRRLKFRRAKMLVEKANVKDNGERKSFKKRDEACSESNSTTTQEKVVLRHQDMQDKKDAQGLFNNVIEETASKLVETRKSKVKALVGAFETVISLQEK